MELTLKRDMSEQFYTPGILLVNNCFECYTCEDVVRETKIPGQTAIPAGRYRVVASFSPRFQRLMPELKDVPNFVGVRIHTGNTAADTEGCILVGQMRAPTGVSNSRVAYTKLWPKIYAAYLRGEEIWITVCPAGQ